VWIYSSHSFGICQNQVQNETLTPNLTNNTFKLEFLKKGTISFIKNNEALYSKRITFSVFDKKDNTVLNNAFEFIIYFEPDEYSGFQGFINNDTIKFNYDGFPFITNQGCEGYFNTFIKTN